MYDTAEKESYIWTSLVFRRLLSFRNKHSKKNEQWILENVKQISIFLMCLYKYTGKTNG